eukprot:superscaffoldBa00000320_g3774
MPGSLSPTSQIPPTPSPHRRLVPAPFHQLIPLYPFLPSSSYPGDLHSIALSSRSRPVKYPAIERGKSAWRREGEFEVRVNSAHHDRCKHGDCFQICWPYRQTPTKDPEPMTQTSQLRQCHNWVPHSRPMATAPHRDTLESSCSSVAGSGQYDPVVPVGIQDSETNTVNWVLQMDDASDGDTTASQPNCSPVVAMGAQPPETKPSAECVVSQDAPSQPSADEAQYVPSPEHATDTQPAQSPATSHRMLAQLSQLQHSYQAVLEENRRLCQDRLRSGTELWLQDANRTLRAQIQSLQTRAEDSREKGQTGQTSTAANMATQEPSDVPDLKEVPSPGATSRSLPQKALQVTEQMTPVHQEMQASSLMTLGDAVFDHRGPDDCQMPPSAQPMDTGINDDYEPSGARSGSEIANGKIDFCFYQLNSMRAI